MTRSWIRAAQSWARLTDVHLAIAVGMAAAGGATVATLLYVRGHRYEARLTIAAAGNGRSGNAAAALAGLAPPDGFHSSPLVVAQLMSVDGLLDEMGRASLRDSSTVTIADALQGSRSWSRATLVRELRRRIGVTIDRPSGLISIVINHHDSAVVRAIAQTLVERTRVRFALVMKSQAHEARVALGTRVDSAARLLAQREDAFRVLSNSNRSVAPFSQAGLQSVRLRREVELADGVYRQAVTDYQTAVARELENTPALLVVDGMPVQVSQLPVGLVRCVVLGFVIAGGTVLVLVLLRRAALLQPVPTPAPLPSV